MLRKHPSYGVAIGDACNGSPRKRVSKAQAKYYPQGANIVVV